MQLLSICRFCIAINKLIILQFQHIYCASSLPEFYSSGLGDKICTNYLLTHRFDVQIKNIDDPYIIKKKKKFM